jgi:hypothetical protein
MKKYYFISLVIAVIFFTLGWTGSSHLKTGNMGGQSRPIRENSIDYKFINPLLAIDNSKTNFPELNPLKKSLEDYINDNISNSKASQISVYFRDVNTIKWAGVNENALYSPGSMLKVATLMAYLKTVNQNPILIQKKFYYQPKDDPGQFYKPKPLKEGYYESQTLLKQMIINSDNIAMGILDQELLDPILKLYEELDLPTPLGSKEDFMSPIQYSRMFRTLYNATYISRSYSEQALQLLTFTSFDKGIVSGVPASVIVAHKFGEQTFTQNGVVEHRELHDCGIVYFPEHPYLICIMTKGQSFPDLEKVISGISKIAYDYQNRQ